MIKRDLTVPGNVITVTLFLALLSLPSCKARPNLVIHQSDTLSVVLRELPGGYPSITPVDHPYTVPPEAVSSILESLTVDTGSVLPFSKSHPRRVFSKTQAEQLTPELSNALRLSPPQQVIAFAVAEPEKPDRQTTGFVFVLNDEMHLIIEHLRRPRYEGEQTSYQQPVSNWKLRPTGNQRLYARHVNGKGAKDELDHHPSPVKDLARMKHRQIWLYPYSKSRRLFRNIMTLIMLLLHVLVPNLLFAQTSRMPSMNDKENSVEQLKERLLQMEEQHRKELADLKERLGVVEQQQSSLSDELAQNIRVGAYGAVWFESVKDRRTTYDGNFELLISGQFHDRIRVYTEIDLGLPHGTADAEQAYVDLLLTQIFNVRAGVLLIPFGKFNLDHFDPRRDLIRPPSVARLVTPTTWSDLGFSAFGLIPISDNVKATYEVQVINGLTDKFMAAPGNIPDPGLQSARTGLRPDNNGDKAIVGRATLKFFDQYEVGLSGYRGDYKTGSQDLITGIAFDTEFKPRNVKIWENFQLRSEFARFDVQGSPTLSSLWGYYIQLTYRFWPSALNSTILGRHFNNPTFALVGLYGRTKMNTTASPTGSLTGEQMIIGFNYRPVEDYVFKMEYQFNNGQFNQFPSDGFLTSIAWIF